MTSWRRWHFAVSLALLTTTILVTPSHGFAISRTKIAEEAVQHQLDALRKLNVAEAFEYNSEPNQAVTGPWQSFAASLADSAFRPLLGHSESCVLMTVNHGEYVCCLVKVVPGNDPLPARLAKVIRETRIAEGLEGEEEDEEEDDEEGEGGEKTAKAMPLSALYWWEVSKQYGDDEEDYHYLVDSILPDAEDLELDYMETTLFAIGDEYEEDDDDDEDPLGFFFDLGLS